MRDKLLERFNKLYPKKRLLAIELNGFSHIVYYDNGKGTDAIEHDSYSYNMPEGNWTENSKMLFASIGHIQYQNNAEQLIYVDIQER